MTHVHRRIWSELYAIATAREPWQFEGIPESARELFAAVTNGGRVRTDQMLGRGSRRSLGSDARSLEARLLVFSEDIHTDSGAHAKAIESWEHWAGRIGFSPSRVSATSARERLDRIAQELSAQHGGRSFMPWNGHRARSRRR